MIVQSVRKETLNRETSATCVLAPDGRIVFVNDAWDRFAAQNGGGPNVMSTGIVGTTYLEHIDGKEVRAFYADVLEDARRSTPAIVVPGECNTPALRREIVTSFQRLRVGSELRGIVVVSSIVRESPLDVPREPEPSPEVFVNADGIILQCCCCRRVKVPGADRFAWRIVPSMIAHVDPRTSHTFCPVCLETYIAPRIAHKH